MLRDAAACLSRASRTTIVQMQFRSNVIGKKSRKDRGISHGNRDGLTRARLQVESAALHPLNAQGVQKLTRQKMPEQAKYAE